MKKCIAFFILFAHFILDARSQSIDYQNNTSWMEVLEKAKKENKYIFIDCYATWCEPCKRMEKTIFVNDTVANFMNQGFISVKMQMDRTSHDNVNIRSWYGVADSLGIAYRVKGYPTYLFFSPDGIAVHKGVGEVSVQDFLILAYNALDPQRQYYALLAIYEHGNMSYALMPLLAKMAKKLDDDSVALAIAGDYIHQFVEHSSDEEMWTKDNLNFIYTFRQAIHSQDIIFKKYLKQKSTIDSVIGARGYSDGLINYVINQEEIKPMVEAGIQNLIEPHWKKMEKTIKGKYGISYSYGILKGRVRYYEATKEWAKYATYFVRQINATHVRTWPKGSEEVLNNDAFEVFKYSHRKKELEYALTWINYALSLHTYPSPNELDTKANLLYKLDRANEAIPIEQQAAKLAPQDKEIQDAYTKMTKRLPTWQSDL